MRNRREILAEVRDLAERQEILRNICDGDNMVECIAREIERIEGEFDRLERELHGKIGG